MSPRGSRWVLLVLLVFELLVFFHQLGPEQVSTSLVQRASLGAMGPVARLIVSIEGRVKAVFDRRHRERWLRTENERLVNLVGVLERELLRRQSVELDFQRLAAAMNYARDEVQTLQVGDVILVDHSSWLRSLILHVGGEGATVGQAVVDSKGVIGRVVVTSRGYAKVQLVTDPASAVGAMIARTRRQGVARGTGPSTLDLDYVPLNADVRVGDRVVSAGVDGIYPRGLTVGIVRKVTPGTDLFLRIEVQPAVDFGLLDGVYLLPLEEFAPAELGGLDGRS